MTAQLAPLGVQKFFDNQGQPLAFGLVYTYQAGTTTLQATYTDSTQSTPNTNPIQLNARGECAMWFDPTLGYKVNITDQAGNQLPGWPVDNIPGGFGALPLSVSLIPNPSNTWTLGNSTHSWAQLYLGANASPAIDTTTGIIGYFPRIAAEIAALVTPTNYAYEPYDLRRYGLVADGITDNTSLFSSLVTAFGTTNPVKFAINGGDFVIGTASVSKNITLWFRGNGRILAKSAATLTISGAIEASDRENIFTGTGTIATGAGIHRLSNPWWFGAVGDGVTDDTSAVQKALTFAGDLGEVLINGRFFCASASVLALPGASLLLGRWTKIRGESVAWANPVGTSNTAPGLVTNLASGYLLTGGTQDASARNAPEFENFYIYNSTGVFSSHVFSGNTAAAIKSVDNVIGDRLRIEGFQHGVELSNNSLSSGGSCFYSRFRTCEWLTCSIAVYSTTPAFDLTFLDCKSALTASFHNASNSTNATTNLKIIGGSIEHYTAAIDQTVSVSIFGTYFETDAPGAFGLFSTQAINNIVVGLFGCTVYLDNHNRFVNLSGRTAVSLSAHGNDIHGATAAASGAYMYYLPTTGTVDIGGDVVTSTWTANYSINDTSRYNIQYPLGVGKDNQYSMWNNNTASATAGVNGAPPAQVAGYVIMRVNGTDFKVPFYNV